MSTESAITVAAWKQASLHQGIQAFASGLLPIVQAAIPLRQVLIRRLESTRMALETVAIAGQGGTPAVHRSQFDAARWQILMEDCLQGVFWPDADGLNTRLPGVIPAGVRGAVCGVGLAYEGAAVGVALFILSSSIAVGEDRAGLLLTLADPCAVALENDRQLREFSALREAAEAERRSLLQRLGRRDIADTIIGAQTGLQDVMERVERVARSDTPVLILGETGTGKEVVARAIHQRSPRADGPFLRVNCGALPPELIDSELFGHERGSFTGAVEGRKGWFERADGGTLLLDEIGELTTAAQVRLLRVLQDGSFQRVGGQRTLTVDVRVVAATNRDLRAMVSSGAFREDLWYRIAVFPIRLPALRERPEDIPSMATHFALRAAERLGLARQIPTADDLGLLAAYAWPGNVRELQSVIERAAILGDGRRLEVAQALGSADLGPQLARQGIAKPPVTVQEVETLDVVMRQHIESTLTRSHGRIEGPFGAAAILGINPHTLRARMRKLGIDWRVFRAR